MSLREASLGRPSLFRLFNRIISRGNRDVVVEEYIRPAKGDRVLDVGCGYGELSSRLDQATYIGIDISPKYIDYANLHYGNFGRFICGDITEDSVLKDLRHFDVVTIIGVLHHLSDTECETLLSSAKRLLSADGRLVTLNGVFTHDQPAIIRLLLRAHRGRFVRTEKHYRKLLSEQFEISTGDIRRDLLSIPYSHFITVCRPR